MFIVDAKVKELVYYYSGNTVIVLLPCRECMRENIFSGLLHNQWPFVLSVLTYSDILNNYSQNCYIFIIWKPRYLVSMHYYQFIIRFPIVLDFFYTVNHRLLIQKLYNSTQDSAICRVIQNLLSNRRFYVELNNGGSIWRLQKNCPNDTACTMLDNCRHLHKLCQFLMTWFRFFGRAGRRSAPFSWSTPHKSGGGA